MPSKVGRSTRFYELRWRVGLTTPQPRRLCRRQDDNAAEAQAQRPVSDLGGRKAAISREVTEINTLPIQTWGQTPHQQPHQAQKRPIPSQRLIHVEVRVHYAPSLPPSVNGYKIRDLAASTTGPELLTQLQEAARLRRTGAFPDDFTVILIEASD